VKRQGFCQMPSFQSELHGNDKAEQTHKRRLDWERGNNLSVIAALTDAEFLARMGESHSVHATERLIISELLSSLYCVHSLLYIACCYVMCCVFVWFWYGLCVFVSFCVAGSRW
jgi:hypothetical protein